MNTSIASRLGLFSLTLLASAVGCAPVGDAPDDESGATQEIVNGYLLSTPTVEAYGLVSINANGSFCSAVLYKNSWVLTAAHCFGFTAPTSGVTATMGTQSRTSDRVRLIPNADLAVVHVTAPFSVNGSTTGFTMPLHTGTITSLQGQSLYCFGAGTYGFNPGGGVQLDFRWRWAPMTVASYAADLHLYSFAPNASGQIQGPGDSGGPCFISQNGRLAVTGIQRNGGLNCANLQPGQTCNAGTATSIDWADQTHVTYFAATLDYYTGGLPRWP